MRGLSKLIRFSSYYVMTLSTFMLHTHYECFQCLGHFLCTSIYVNINDVDVMISINKNYFYFCKLSFIHAK